MRKVSKALVQDVNEGVVVLILGLTANSIDDKQKAMEDALRLICTDDWVDKAKIEFKW